jgi:hypothetical protein
MEPPLTKIRPAGSRLVTIVLPAVSPMTESNPLTGEKIALVAMLMILQTILAPSHLRLMAARMAGLKLPLRGP